LKDSKAGLKKLCIIQDLISGWWKIGADWKASREKISDLFRGKD